jgi:hypothetical protein
MFCRRGLLGILLVAAAARTGWCASGTEGASFLDIPVGGAPAALGSAYTAQATDVYAPVWNPAGLGFLNSMEFTGTHLSYLGPVYYEHASFVMPLGKDHETNAAPAGFGASAQYLGTGDLDARDAAGNPAGSFTSSFAAYSVAYGQRIFDNLSFGGSAKLITEKIADASASAYAADAGLLYKPNARLNVGAVLANVGSDIKFVNEADPLPTAGRVGATYHINPTWDVSAEGVYRKTGLTSGSMGVEWRYGENFSFRGGYNTAHIKELGGGAGVTAGLGIFFWGQEFSYAWVPLGDLGTTHYFSLVFRLSKQTRPDKPRLKAPEDEDFEDLKDEHGKWNDRKDNDSLYQLLNDDEKDHESF